jgi:predicted HTH domain antitoxin
MKLTVELPNDIAQHENAAHEALEAVAVEAYRSDAMTRPEAAKLISAGRLEFQDILYRHGVYKNAYDVDSLLEDIATGDRMRAEGLLTK